MSPINVIISAAMPQEMAQFTKLLAGYTLTELETRIGSMVLATKGRSRLVLLTTGVGMVAASSALSWALSSFVPRAVVSIGSAGGLAADARVRQVVVGSDYVHGGADGTAFGYVRGQVPGQPESFSGDTDLISAARDILKDSHRIADIRIGQMLSSDAFVTEKNVADIRNAFPAALTADMESHALAQVCAAFNIPFLSVRSISDLCGEPDDQTVSFHAELDDVAALSAKTALDLLYRTKVLNVVRSTHGPSQRFDRISLQAAIYLMIALKNGRKTADPCVLPEEVADDLRGHLPNLTEEQFQEVLSVVAAGYELVETDKSMSLTAKDYDTQRATIIEKYGPISSPGSFAWPPTSQTIIKRFNGYWNDALATIGLKPRRGRARGGLKFTDRDYIFAVRSYIVDVQHDDRNPSFNGYATWLKETDKTGKLPSGAAIRQRFGSWKEALEAATLRPEKLSSSASSR